MRTTLTLDQDVAAGVDRVRKARGLSLKQVINDALRLGLRSMLTKPRPRAPLRTRVVDLGRCRVGSIDDVAEAVAVSEGETFA